LRIVHELNQDDPDENRYSKYLEDHFDKLEGMREGQPVKINPNPNSKPHSLINSKSSVQLIPSVRSFQVDSTSTNYVRNARGNVKKPKRYSKRQSNLK
jgi:hypothetical protein